MKKGILCILLSVLLLVPMLVSCNRDTGLVGTEAIVYTLYTICEEGTTEEAITEVELALNRILFYRLGIILKLEMVEEDEYDELIAEKYEEVKEYQDAIMDGEEVSVDDTLVTGDDILKMLEKGEEIPLKQPRFDIFLVRGYDDYYQHVSDGNVQELDAKLDTEAKALKSYIHSTLFESAKIGNKIYGVPVNHAIDENTYLVFDKNYLNGVNPNTILSLEDLESYLKAVKENDPNVVPLKSTIPSNAVFNIYDDGFPVMVNKTGPVLNTYQESVPRNYFAMIARYNKLGYLGSKDDPEGTKYAVRFEKGNEAELKELYPDCEIVEYSAPVANNYNALENIFCVSKFVAANEITDVMKLVTAIYTDAELMNILTYGVENEHYILSDEGQIKRERQDYIIKPENVGNPFIANTLVGEDVDKWEKASLHNQKTIASPALGFSPSPIILYETDETKIFEPDYFTTINEISSKYYEKLMAGEVDFNYNEFYNTAKNKKFADIEKDLRTHYEQNVLRPKYEKDIRDNITAAISDQKYEEAKKTYMDALFESTKGSWEINLYNEFMDKYPNASGDEIAQMVNDKLTDEFVNQKILEENKQSEIDTAIKDLATAYVNQAITAEIDKMATSPKYVADLNALLASARYNNELRELKLVAEQQDIPVEVNKLILQRIDEDFITPMMDEINFALEAMVNEYFEEYKETLGFTELNELLIAIEYLTEVTPEATEETEEPVEPVYQPAFDSWYEFVFNAKISKIYTALKEQTA